ncbi:MAG: TIGR01458 family HAD-type hydrolase [Longimicrobiales bacterium]|nr:TIGR01458 family HAD-type hydrolase [Longimicrobiales bacterium]
MTTSRPSGLLLDLDGTVYQDDEPVPGAVTAIAELRDGGLPLRFVTNTTRVARGTIAGWLEGFGIPADADDIFTPPFVAMDWLRERELRRVAVLLPEDSQDAFSGFELAEPGGDAPEAVVIGDLGEGWTFEVLNRAFRWLLDGAAFLALHRNRYWRTGGELVLDAGAFVAALEYATGREATVVGKPSRPMFAAAARSMGLSLEEVAMVGDDLEADIGGSQALGCTAFMVRTGKFRAEELAESAVEPDRVIDSVAELPAVVLG